MIADPLKSASDEDKVQVTGYKFRFVANPLNESFSKTSFFKP